MASSLYWLGVILALLAGSTTQLGSVFQKKAVNEISTELKFMKTLVKRPTWILGVILSFGISSIFYLAAQSFIGPALIPGLTAFGLIVLALGSIKIVGERLKFEDIIGIFLMITGTILLSLSQLSIEIIEINLLEVGLVIRITIFTIILVILSFLCHIFQKMSDKYKGILFAILSGFMFTLSNLWVSQLIGTITDIFSGFLNLAQLIMFIIAAIILVFSNILGLATIQHAYRVGNASHMVPIQQVPILIAPIFIYFLVFLMVAPSFFSIVYLILGIALIIISVFLFGKRAAQMEEIK
ncbi:MAG: DMT family transporter [Candidatus Hermodarchaeota archaeon]